jgi:hypothetical protein
MVETINYLKSKINYPPLSHTIILNSIQNPELGMTERDQIYLLLGAVDSVSSTE